jgi:peroxiredoxin
VATLTERLAFLRAKHRTMLKPEISEKIQRSIDELRVNGTVAAARKTGDRAPAFTLPDQYGAIVSSTELLRQGALVVAFCRGTWCPYSTAELQALSEAYPAIREHGAEMVAIMSQAPGNARAYFVEHPVAFPVLVDGDLAVAQAFGLVYALPQYLKDVYQSVFANDLSAVNAGGAWQLPMPARYIIQPGSRVVAAHVDADYRYRQEPAETIALLATATWRHSLANIS